jgi:uncharacterized repeat protein (TIGR03833 family)
LLKRFFFYINIKCCLPIGGSKTGGTRWYDPEVQEGTMTEINRSDIKAGARVKVVRKQDQRTGILTEGIVRDVLTKSPHHPHGIKVRLEGGIVGRVKEVLGA